MSDVREKLVAIARTKEIVARLRACDWEIRPVDSVYDACGEAADEIERLDRRVIELEAEIAKLRGQTDGRWWIPLWY